MIDRQKIYQKYGGRCAYCGKKIKFKKLQIDHINPSYTKTRDRESNLNPSCRECNFWKLNHRIEDYRKRLQKLDKYLAKRTAFKVGKNYGILKTKKWEGTFYFEKEKIIDEVRGNK